MNELKSEDVMRAFELYVQRHLMPNVDIDGTVRVEDAERWFLKLLKEQLAPYITTLLREKDAEIKGLVDGWSKDQDRFEQVCAEKDAEIERLNKAIEGYAELEQGCIVTGYKKIRAEAIDEFAERLGKWFSHDPAFLGVEKRLVLDVVDKIAKEMKEGSKDA